MKINVSLRGSLAGDCILDLMKPGVPRKNLDKYLASLVESDDPDLLKYSDNGITIIGKLSERGHFPPDW